ncbi:hypothetical protein [Methyloceanibacter sp.]|jgi:hypothetical protein|uniref:hypothetical protein n=1 Tax=Methyloceanibacter sp. TaxID=1965321 RepID=UPI002D135C3C|nr:hypothetical protein [Methyloceanibacter sp.]
MKLTVSTSRSISPICSAIAAVRIAIARCSCSTMRPSTTITPFFAFSGLPKAEMILRAQATSSSVGEKI